MGRFVGSSSSIEVFPILAMYVYLKTHIQTPIIPLPSLTDTGICLHNLTDIQQIVYSTTPKVIKAVQPVLIKASEVFYPKVIKTVQPVLIKASEVIHPIEKIAVPVHIESVSDLQKLGNWIWEKADGLPGGRPTLVLVAFAFMYFLYSEVQNSKRRSPPGWPWPWLPPFRRAPHYELVQPIKIYT
jgi:hypothetical protein